MMPVPVVSEPLAGSNLRLPYRSVPSNLVGGMSVLAGRLPKPDRLLSANFRHCSGRCATEQAMTVGVYFNETFGWDMNATSLGRNL
jgi:hypothetical protein